MTLTSDVTTQSDNDPLVASWYRDKKRDLNLSSANFFSKIDTFLPIPNKATVHAQLTWPPSIPALILEILQQHQPTPAPQPHLPELTIAAWGLQVSYQDAVTFHVNENQHRNDPTLNLMHHPSDVALKIWW